MSDATPNTDPAAAPNSGGHADAAPPASVSDQNTSAPTQPPNEPGGGDYDGDVAASENAIGTQAPGVDEAAGGDPESPADRALESALKREADHAHEIVEENAHTGETALHGDDETAAELDTATPVDPQELERTVEALLFAAAEPIAVREIARAADSDSATIRKVLKALKETGDRERRPWDLVEVANAWRLVTRPEFHGAIQRLKTQASQRKLTQAALETLALIAYRQPIGRAEVESVRGVNAGPVLRLLLEKKLIQISGRGSGAGQPLLYGTTDFFLENFGLKNVAELPKPGEFKNA